MVAGPAPGSRTTGPQWPHPGGPGAGVGTGNWAGHGVGDGYTTGSGVGDGVAVGAGAGEPPGVTRGRVGGAGFAAGLTTESVKGVGAF